MRLILKICATISAAAILIVVVSAAWFCLDTSGLPDVGLLEQYLRPNATEGADSCTGPSSAVVSYDGIGRNMRSALGAAETTEGAPDVWLATYREITGSANVERVSLSQRIARTVFCSPSKPLTRAINELRTAVQLERRFSKQQLFTIFANRLTFADRVVGVEAASQHFFHKHSNDLSVDEAALLAGVSARPNYYAPCKHADRAISRRDLVIDTMAQRGAISVAEKESAESAPLQVSCD